MPALIDASGRPYLPQGQYGPVGSGVGVPGLGAPYKLDMDQLLASYPGLASALQGIAGQLTMTTAPFNEASRAAFITYGGVPQNLPPGVTVDDETRLAAQKATQGGISTLAQQARAYALANSTAASSAAARGIGRSGSYGYHALQNLHDYNVNQATAQAGLLSTLAGYRQQVGQAEQTALGQRTTAVQNAQNEINKMITSNQFAAPKTQTTAAPSLRTDPNTFLPGGKSIGLHGTPSNPFGLVPGRGRAPY